MGILDRRRALMSKPETPRHETFPSAPIFYKLNSTGITTDGKATQGACYVDIGTDNAYLYFVTVTNDNATQYLYRYDLSNGGYSKVGTYTELGHANSLTFMPSTNEIFVGTADTATGVVAISVTDHTISRTFQIYDGNGDPAMPWGIAYDRTNDLIYSLHGTSTVFVYSNTWTYLRSVSLLNAPSHVGNTAQSLETDGEYFYRTFYSPNSIEVYDLNGALVAVQSIGTSYELQELCYDWHGKFFANEYRSSGNQNLYAILVRTFNFYFNMAYTPESIWTARSSGGTVVKWGNNSFTFNSTASAAWNLYVFGAGYPFSYSEIKDKNCKISLDMKRASGSSGSILVSIFTTNSQAVTANTGVIYQSAKTFDIPQSTTAYEHFEFDFIPGTSFFLPPEGDEGTYVGFRIYCYAASGNKCYVKNIKIGVEV